MKFTATQLVLIGIVVVIVTAVILLFTGVIPGLRTNQPSGLSGAITVWGIFDDEKAIGDSLIADFKLAFPNVIVTYRQVDEATYEQDLINALAAGNGPDVFYVKNTWLIKHADKLSPLSQADFPPTQIPQLFPDVVGKDFILNDQVYALPLYLDSLALFYNKTILDQAGIAQPPKTWVEFENVVKKLTRFDNVGRIARAGAAIGGSARSINEASDLLSLVMLQQGTQMVSPNLSQATFSESKGKAALDYYTSFARPNSRTYTWDPLFHYSIDAFSEEKVAMIFNYAFQIAQIKEKNPFLNFAVSPMPQIDPDKAVNYANYWGLGVSNKTSRPDLAWAFVLSATIDEATNLHYLNSAKRPPALRSLIAISMDDPVVGVFSRQALTATDWPQVDATAINIAFTRMIDFVNSGQLTSSRAIEQAEEEITRLMKTRLGTDQ